MVCARVITESGGDIRSDSIRTIGPERDGPLVRAQGVTANDAYALCDAV